MLHTTTARRSAAALPDTLLMERVQAGSTVAFGVLYDRHSSRAWRVARSACSTSGTADEAVQDAFEAIWKARATFVPGRGPVVPWMMAVVRHRALTLSRRARHHMPERPGDVLTAERVSYADELEYLAIRRSSGSELRMHLARIPYEQREVIALAFYGGLTHTEIAERLGLPAGTVKGRMRLGFDKLRVELERTGA